MTVEGIVNRRWKLTMSILRSWRSRLERMSQSAALCGVPAAGAGSGGALSSYVNGPMPLIALTGVFIGAGVLMFRKWGKSPAPQNVPEGETTNGGAEGGLANA